MKVVLLLREGKMNKSSIIKSKLAIIFVAVFLILLLAGMVSAVNVGVSPATITFKNVLRGGYSQGNVVISVDSTSPTNITVSPIGNISSWLNFTQNFTVSRDNPYVLPVSVTPPDDIPNGNYTGFLKIETASLSSGSQGQFVGIVRSTLDVYVTVEVVDTQILQCSASKFSVQSAEQGDNVIFNMNVTNNGNVIMNPQVAIDVWDENQTRIVKHVDVNGGQILPSLQKQISVSMNSAGLPISQYWADVSVVDCLASSLLTFDVLEPGALTANGILLDILTEKTATTGQTIPIEASFKNTGEKEVSAQFQGQITYNGRIVQLLNSPSFNVQINQISNFNFYFTPRESGAYIISGRVYYSGKQTYESSATVEVSSNSVFNVLLPLLYAVLILIIIFLFLKIIKEKWKYKEALRRLRK